MLILRLLTIMHLLSGIRFVEQQAETARIGGRKESGASCWTEGADSQQRARSSVTSSF